MQSTYTSAIMLKLCVLVAVPLVCHGFLFGRDQSNWNGLKVTWGINPLTSFKNVPRSQHDAARDGWKAMDHEAACDAHPNFLGHRYIKDNDLGVILIFDANGYIAGIQMGFPKNYSPNPNKYPLSPLIDKPLVLDGGNYYITAYFINPADVCTGRSPVEFASQGTGVGLWIQNGTNPVRDAVSIPLQQTDVDNTAWTKGVCFLTMGQHYWYDISKTMSCDRLFPMFLLYNRGVLNGFGWALAMDLEHYSSRVEHPAQSSYGMFMDPIPDCLPTLGTLTTLHIYLTDSAISDTC